MTRHYDAILFDFDGVLADTEPIHWACWAETLAPLGIELTWDTYRSNCVGVADRNMLAFLASLARQPLDPETLRPQYAGKKDLFRRRILEAKPCASATVEMIQSLTEYGLAVVTSSGRQEVEPVLEYAGIRACLGAAIYGEDVKRHKPDPEPYLLAASRLGCQRPLVVEDSAAGVASGTAAGFDVIQVPSAAQTPELVLKKILRSS